MTGHWRTRAAAALDRDSLAALFANAIPAIRIPDFATPEECRSFAAATRRREMRAVRGDTEHGAAGFAERPILHLGLTQAEYKRRGVATYLDASAGATAETREVTRHSFDPLARMIERLGAHVDGTVEVAREADGRPYFAGIIRNSNRGLMLHADFAPYQAPQFAVAAVERQLAWNFYAETPAAGGITTVHNAPWTWTPSFAGEVAENYPLAPRLVEGAETWSFQPVAGEAVLFNTRNPHIVSPVEPGARERIAMAAFFGRLPSGDIVVWS